MTTSEHDYAAYTIKRRQLLAPRAAQLRFHSGAGDPNEYLPVKIIDAEVRLLDAEWALERAGYADHLAAIEQAVANLGRKSDPAIAVLAGAISQLCADRLATLQSEYDEAMDARDRLVETSNAIDAKHNRPKFIDGARRPSPGHRWATPADIARAGTGF